MLCGPKKPASFCSSLSRARRSRGHTNGLTSKCGKPAPARFTSCFFLLCSLTLNDPDKNTQTERASGRVYCFCVSFSFTLFSAQSNSGVCVLQVLLCDVCEGGVTLVMEAIRSPCVVALKNGLSSEADELSGCWKLGRSHTTRRDLQSHLDPRSRLTPQTSPAP